MLLVFKKIIDLQLTVRQTERLAKTLSDNKESNKVVIRKSQFYDNIENKLKIVLNSKTIIKEKNDKGKIIITFSSKKNFHEIVNKIFNEKK